MTSIKDLRKAADAEIARAKQERDAASDLPQDKTEEALKAEQRAKAHDEEAIKLMQQASNQQDRVNQLDQEAKNLRGE